MKSTEVYAQLKSQLEPWFKTNGFKRVKGLLGWSRPHGNVHVVVWFQISRDGWDPYAGSKFVVEFQRSPEPVIGGRPEHRQRLGSLISEVEREEVRSIQNAVIARVQPAPASHPPLHVSQEVRDWYLKKFQPVNEPYSGTHDIWLRYASAGDVACWARFILAKLPQCIAAVEGWTDGNSSS